MISVVHARGRSLLAVSIAGAILSGAPLGKGGGGDRIALAHPVAGQVVHHRGIRENAPWLSFYGNSRQMGDLKQVAARFRFINIDADPTAGNFTRADIATLRAGGRNTVVSYLNVGACERYRRYWATAPAGVVPCGENRAAQIAPYGRYPREVWMNPGNADYRRLIVEHVAPRLAATGVDGFFLDNLEIIEHGPHDAEAPCDTTCVRGGLMLVGELRHRFPDLVVVMQNATSSATRSATVAGAAFPSLLDGVSREETYAPRFDRDAETDLLAWKALGLKPNGQRFSITTEDYVGGCGQVARAQRVYARSRERGFSPYATISSANQDSVCFWPF